MKLNRTVALVGMMGAGKSSVGRRLAARLAVVFRDADSEIESAVQLAGSHDAARHENVRRTGRVGDGNLNPSVHAVGSRTVETNTPA